MRLEIARFQVEDVVFTDQTNFTDGVLHVDKQALRELVVQDDHFVDVQIDFVRPGDKTRIINILDVVEPRHKISGPSTVFPGILGPPVTVGQGRDHTLKGLNLITTGEPAPGEAVHFRDSILDMWGTGAEYSPFSDTPNLVVHITGTAGFSPEQRRDLERTDSIHGSSYAQEYNLAARIAGFRVADYLASATRDQKPNDIDSYELAPVESPLPRVAYSIQQYRPFLYGQQIGWQPTLVHPNEVLDGALFKAFVGVGSNRDVTYSYQNHPIIQELYDQHGVSLDFAGVLLYTNGGEQLAEKERITGYATKLLKMLDVDGLVMTWNGGGHPGMDIMLLCQKCEQQGIKTTLLNPEMARTKTEPGFVHMVPEADAIVSTGNYETPITLPPADKVLGGAKLAIPEIDASGELHVPLRYVFNATSTQGHSRVIGVQY